MPQARRGNRGPGAAAENRAALVAAAREVFASGGFNAPLSAVARRAGVGQGSLYRHFPDRLSLALAAFAENIADLEAAAALADSTLDDLLALLTEQAISATAFLDMLSGHAEDPRVGAMSERVTAVLAGKLPAARRRGRYGDHVEAADLLMAVGMVSGLVARSPAADRREAAERAWALLRGGLQGRNERAARALLVNVQLNNHRPRAGINQQGSAHDQHVRLHRDQHRRQRGPAARLRGQAAAYR
jgi:AcrR family transcriptional regulator